MLRVRPAHVPAIVRPRHRVVRVGGDVAAGTTKTADLVRDVAASAAAVGIIAFFFGAGIPLSMLAAVVGGGAGYAASEKSNRS